MSNPPRLTKLAERIVSAAEKLATSDEQELVFRHGIFCQVGLPHSRQTERRFERVFKNASILIQAGELWDGYKWVEQPLPFGAKPRVAMFYIDSEAVKHRSVFIDIGKSFNQFGELIDIPAAQESRNPIRIRLCRRSSGQRREGPVSRRSNSSARP